MTEGRELDALIAERVFGEHVVWVKDKPWESKGQPYANGHFTSHYSSNIKAAWEIFGRMFGHVERRGHPRPGEEWVAQLWYGGRAGQAYAETAPLAICLAALAALDPEARPNTGASDAEGANNLQANAGNEAGETAK
jgi:hypothetical protein